MAVDRPASTRQRAGRDRVLGDGETSGGYRDGHGYPRRHIYGRKRPAERVLGGGTQGNRLLTAQTGAVLILLFFVLGITILRVKQLLSVHMFVGMLLIGPVALKMASTGYRFTRYYTLNARYRRAGPPPPLLRMLAPLVVLSTLAVFATGVALLLVGPAKQGSLLFLHKASFVIWIIVTAVHVILHIAEIPGALSRRYEGELTRRVSEAAEMLPGMQRHSPASEIAAWDAHGTGRAGRLISLASATVGGLVLAVVSIAWFGPWLHWAQALLAGH